MKCWVATNLAEPQGFATLLHSHGNQLPECILSTGQDQCNLACLGSNSLDCKYTLLRSDLLLKWTDHRLRTSPIQVLRLSHLQGKDYNRWHQVERIDQRDRFRRLCFPVLIDDSRTHMQNTHFAGEDRYTVRLGMVRM